LLKTFEESTCGYGGNAPIFYTKMLLVVILRRGLGDSETLPNLTVASMLGLSMLTCLLEESFLLENANRVRKNESLAHQLSGTNLGNPL